MVNLTWINLMKTSSYIHIYTHTRSYKYLIKPNGNSSTGNFIILDLPDTPSFGRQVTRSHFMMHGYHLHSRVGTEAVQSDTSSDGAESHQPHQSSSLRVWRCFFFLARGSPGPINEMQNSKMCSQTIKLNCFWLENYKCGWAWCASTGFQSHWAVGGGWIKYWGYWVTVKEKKRGTFYGMNLSILF